VGKIAIYRHLDGSWTLRAGSGAEAMEAELVDGYLAAEGRGGPPRVLSTKSHELGMTVEQAIRRGVLRLLPRLATNSERPTLIDPGEYEPK